MRFSERLGYRAVREAIQLERLDDKTRTRLANLLSLVVFHTISESSRGGFADLRELADLGRDFLYLLFDEILGIVVPHGLQPVVGIETIVRQRLMAGTWHDVFDFLEFVLAEFFDGGFAGEQEKQAFIVRLNGILEAECCAYRILRDRVVPLTTETEINAVDQAIEHAPTSGAGIHLQRALELLSDREAPDFRNSIKESISAVESACSAITGESATTLGKALKKLDVSGHVAIHPVLNAAFGKLYGYTSNADGIRHALMNEPELSFEDAQFMLVACAAFVSYLKAKAARQTS
jgi:hypothetical protein